MSERSVPVAFLPGIPPKVPVPSRDLFPQPDLALDTTIVQHGLWIDFMYRTEVCLVPWPEPARFGGKGFGILH